MSTKDAHLSLNESARTLTNNTLPSSAHETLSRIQHMLVKISLNIFKKIDIILSIYSEHNGMKLENYN